MLTEVQLTDIYEDSVQLCNYINNAHVNTGKAARAEIEKFKHSIKQLARAQKMIGEQTICVTGRQSSGKTTFLTNLLGLDKKYFYIKEGECELVPIYIKGDMYATDVVMKWEYFLIDTTNTDNGYRRVTETITDPERFAALSGMRGFDDKDTLSLEITFPDPDGTKFCGITFLLLPGQVEDKKNKDINDIIDISVKGSEIAIYVVSPDDLPQEGNAIFMDKVKQMFGNNAIFVLTFQENTPKEESEELRANCAGKLGIDDVNKILLVGTGNEAEWREPVKRAIVSNAKVGVDAYKNLSNYINEIIVEDMRNSIDEIRNKIDGAIIDDNNYNAQNDAVINVFRNERAKFVSKMRRTLQRRLSDARTVDKDKLFEKIEKTNLPYWRRIAWKQMKDIKNINEYINIAMTEDDGSYRVQSAIVNALEDFSVSEFPKIQKKTKELCIEDKKNLTNIKEEPAVSGEISTMQAVIENAAILSSDNNFGELVTAAGIDHNYTKLQKDSVKMSCYLSVSYLTSMMLGGTQTKEFKDYCDKYNITPIKQPENTPLSQSIREGITESQKFLVGVLGITGLDFARDGVLNLVPNIASSVQVVLKDLFPSLNAELIKGGVIETVTGGVAAQKAATAALCTQISTGIALGILGAGAFVGFAKAVNTDITNRKISDYYAGCQYIDEMYQKAEDNMIGVINELLDNTESAITAHLEKINGVHRKTWNMYNAKNVLSRLEDTLDDLSNKISQDDYKHFEAMYC